MKKAKATIHDIAKRLKITASTVSRALNDHPRISDETKKLVHRMADELNYQPNHIAAALRNGRSNIIGVVVPTADRSFFSSVVRGIEEIAHKSHYNVMICQTHDDYHKEVHTIDVLMKAQVDGVIISHAKSDPDFEHLKEVKDNGVPLIMFDRAVDLLDVSHVVIDDFHGAYRATQHLIQQGCRRIAHFTNTKQISIYKERWRGYREALTDHAIDYDPTLVIESDLQLEDGRTSMQVLLDSLHVPDAVFSASAYGALGAMQVAKENGLRVPYDIAIAAFSNEPFTEFTDPALTTVDQYGLHIGNAAAEIFLSEVTKREFIIPQKIVLRPELIIRGSSLRRTDIR